MNPITLERLQKIRAKCKELLAIAEKRTAGSWRVETLHTPDQSAACISAGINREGDGPKDYPVRAISKGRLSKENAAFITSCAGSAESGWKTTISAIDGLIVIRDYCDNYADGSPDACLRDQFANCQLPIIDIVVNGIIAAWEGVELP